MFLIYNSLFGPKAKQSKAKQSKAKQSKAKQSKAKQSKAKQMSLINVPICLMGLWLFGGAMEFVKETLVASELPHGVQCAIGLPLLAIGAHLAAFLMACLMCPEDPV